MGLLDTALQGAGGSDDEDEEDSMPGVDSFINGGQQDSQDKAMSDPAYRSLIFSGLGKPDPLGAKTPDSGHGNDQASSMMASIMDKLQGGGSSPEPTGRAQIRNLKQLGAVAKKLQGVPDELKRRVLAHLLGIPYQDPKVAGLDNTIRNTLFKHELTRPEREDKLATAHQAETRRQASLMAREAQQRAAMAMRKRQQLSTEKYRSEGLKNHMQTHKDSLARTIAAVTRQEETTLDPTNKAELSKTLLNLHKRYKAISDFESKDQDNEGGGSGGGASDTGGGEY